MIQQTNKQGKVEVNNTGFKMTRNNTHLLSFFYSIALTMLGSSAADLIILLWRVQEFLGSATCRIQVRSK
jgi:hypothetical protein